MRSTRYFDEQVMRKRPYLKAGWIEQVLAEPEWTMIQEKESRIRYWGYIKELGMYLRVVTLMDGTVHNAFPDRSYKKEP